MSRNKTPRRPYRPKPINVPITGGLVDMFQEVLLTAEIGLHMRSLTTDHFDAIAAVLNVVGPVAIARLGRAHPDALAIARAAVSMNAAADRAAISDGYMAGMSDPELADVSHGIDAAKATLPLLDARALAVQHRAVQRRRISDRLALETA